INVPNASVSSTANGETGGGCNGNCIRDILRAASTHQRFWPCSALRTAMREEGVCQRYSVSKPSSSRRPGLCALPPAKPRLINSSRSRPALVTKLSGDYSLVLKAHGRSGVSRFLMTLLCLLSVLNAIALILNLSQVSRAAVGGMSYQALMSDPDFTRAVKAILSNAALMSIS